MKLGLNGRNDNFVLKYEIYELSYTPFQIES